jgi:hypothetical protein
MERLEAKAAADRAQMAFFEKATDSALRIAVQLADELGELQKEFPGSFASGKCAGALLYQAAHMMFMVAERSVPGASLHEEEMRAMYGTFCYMHDNRKQLFREVEAKHEHQEGVRDLPHK